MDPNPTIAARVRELAGVSWSRARSLCAEGRVTVDGERCLDPAARIAPGAVVVVDAAGRKLDRGPLAKSAIVFAAFAGWDAAGAKSFGYRTFWVNRANQPTEELGVAPDAMSPSLAGLLEFVLPRATARSAR